MTTIPPAPTPATAPPGPGLLALWRSAGVLAVIAGACLAAWVVWSLFDGYFSWRTALYIAPAALAIVGGTLALQGKRAVAPWLVVAAAVALWVIERVIVSYPVFWPWEPVTSAGAAIDALGLVGGLINTLASLSVWLLPLAAVLAIVAFALSPRSTPSPRVVAQSATISQGVATVSEDGTVLAGWYADPDGKPAERYWDGSAWTDQTRPMTTATAPVLTGMAVKPTVTASGQPISPNSRAAAAIICFFVGVFGIHRFYVGKVGTGVAMLFTLGGLGIWALIDFIWILIGTFTDKSGRVLANW